MRHKKQIQVTQNITLFIIIHIYLMKCIEMFMTIIRYMNLICESLYVQVKK